MTYPTKVRFTRTAITKESRGCPTLTRGKSRADTDSYAFQKSVGSEPGVLRTSPSRRYKLSAKFMVSSPYTALGTSAVTAGIRTGSRVLMPHPLRDTSLAWRIVLKFRGTDGLRRGKKRRLPGYFAPPYLHSLSKARSFVYRVLRSVPSSVLLRFVSQPTTGSRPSTRCRKLIKSQSAHKRGFEIHRDGLLTGNFRRLISAIEYGSRSKADNPQRTRC